MEEPKDAQPTVGPSYTIGELAERLFAAALPSDFIPRKQNPDFFLDYVIETVEKGEPSGKQFAVQVKGVQTGEGSALPKRYAAKGKHVQYWLRDCQHPVFLFLIDVKKGAGLWLFVQRFVREQLSAAALIKQKSVTLRFSRDNALGDWTRFRKELEFAERYVRELHHGNIQAAIARKRLELEEKEPRLSYEISAAEGVQTVKLSPKEPFSVELKIRDGHGARIHEAIKQATEYGGNVKLENHQFQFSGSRLFEEFNDKPMTELLLQFGETRAGNVIFQTSGTPSAAVSVSGAFLIAPKIATFSGGVTNAPVEFNCAIPLPIEGSGSNVKMGLTLRLERWEGHCLLQLTSFEAIHGILNQLARGQPLRTDIFCEGNRLAIGEIVLPIGSNLGTFLKMLDWLQRCRHVAQRYGINPKLPKLSELTTEMWEVVEELYAIAHGARMATPHPDLSATLTYSKSRVKPSDFPIAGCARFDNPAATVSVLGEQVQIGGLRTFFTNVKVELLEMGPDTRSVIGLKGTSETMRVVEGF
jgi:hypothetical protein